MFTFASADSASFIAGIIGYPEGHPDNIETIPGDVDAAVASLSEAEKRRYSISTDETGKKVVMVCRDANYKVAKYACSCSCIRFRAKPSSLLLNLPNIFFSKKMS